jgi:hypothetical protein
LSACTSLFTGEGLRGVFGGKVSDDPPMTPCVKKETQKKLKLFITWKSPKHQVIIELLLQKEKAEMNPPLNIRSYKGNLFLAVFYPRFPEWQDNLTRQVIGDVGNAHVHGKGRADHQLIAGNHVPNWISEMAKHQ